MYLHYEIILSEIEKTTAGFVMIDFFFRFTAIALVCALDWSVDPVLVWQYMMFYEVYTVPYIEAKINV